MEPWWTYPPHRASAAALALGLALMEGLDADQQAQLGNLLMLTGQLMVTWSAQALLLQSRCPAPPDGQLEELRRRLEALEAYCAPPPL